MHALNTLDFRDEGILCQKFNFLILMVLKEHRVGGEFYFLFFGCLISSSCSWTSTYRFFWNSHEGLDVEFILCNDEQLWDFPVISGSRENDIKFIRLYLYLKLTAAVIHTDQQTNINSAFQRLVMYSAFGRLNFEQNSVVPLIFFLFVKYRVTEWT